MAADAVWRRFGRAHVSCHGELLRREDDVLLRGGRFVQDLAPGDAAHAVFVRSQVASARFRLARLAVARGSPGVLGVFVADDLDLHPQAPPAPLNQVMRRPLLATGVIRFAGEAVALVVGETRESAADAAALIDISYRPLPAVADPVTSVGGGRLLFPQAGTNVALQVSLGCDLGAAADSEVVVRHELVNQRVAACPLEPRSVVASWSNGRLTFWVSTQSPHGARDELASCFNLTPSDVRVLSADVGGGFGTKIRLYPEELVVAWAARRLRRTVRWFETRSESMLALGHGRAQLQAVELRGLRDGTFMAYSLSVLQDAGAYPRDAALHPLLTGAMASGPYKIPKVAFRARSAVTNTMSVVVYRGAGQPEATAALERAVDSFADTIGMDPAELRRRNLIRNQDFPYENGTGTVYDSGDYQRLLDEAVRRCDYTKVRDQQRRRRRTPRSPQLGIGLALYVAQSNNPPYSELARVVVDRDATVMVLSGTRPQGQGHETALAHLVSRKLGIPAADVAVVLGDTDLLPSGVGTMASRSLQTAGVAVTRAASQVIERARRVAALVLETGHDRIAFDAVNGEFVNRDGGARAAWSVIAAAAYELGDGGSEELPLHAEVEFVASGPTCPSGAHVAIVEVDVETGAVKLCRLVAVDDAGCRMFPALAEGQIHGGLAQGCAQALTERVVYDRGAVPLTTSLQRYGCITAASLPTFETYTIESPSSVNELGVKGIGEAGAIGSAVAVQNAVVDALRHLGVDHVDMPLTPERVWRAIQARAPERYR
jgi:carbon-monoxide dehydrogenase large subunit